MNTQRLALSCLAVAATLLASCVARAPEQPVAKDLRLINIGLVDGYKAAVVADGLRNPSFVSFRPGDGTLTVADSGHGRVILVRDGRVVPIIEGMATEFWKHEGGVRSFQVGPLAATWLDNRRLAVTDGGMPDGEEAVLTYRVRGDSAELVARTNTVPPLTDHPEDPGEGNLTGTVLAPDGRTLYVCSQGDDLKTWLLVADLQAGTLEPWVASKDEGIEPNSPMQALLWRGNLLVVYSGAGGVNDGAIVEWDINTRKPLNVWKLPELVDPMGIALVPGTNNEFVVTDNNWDLREVKSGRIARVRLHDNGQAQVTVIATQVPGPVHCAFGPDGRLYVTCLGDEIDKDKGLVISIKGFAPRS